MRRTNHLLLLSLLALFFVPLGACRQASSQNAVAQAVQSDDPRLYTKDIPLPAPLTDRAEQILYRKAYVVSYNKDTRQPNWVAWHLTADHTSGDVERPGTAWHDDKDVPEPRAYHYDYRDACWDRGHMCPAGDNKWDEEAMYESFLMSNACPQNKALNSGVWNQIEISCRTWARKYGDVYIICGPIFLNQEHDTIGVHNIPVPEAFFKIIVHIDGKNSKGIGFICRNNEGGRKKDLYTNSISEVERITGITFFPDIDTDVATLIKSNSDLNAF